MGTKRAAPVDVALVKQPNVYLRLIDFDPETKESPAPRALNSPGYFHICFLSPSTDSAYDRFRDAGLEMVSRGDQPVDIGGYGVLYAYGRDPDGTVIEMESSLETPPGRYLGQPDRLYDPGPGPPDRVFQRCDWVRTISPH